MKTLIITITIIIIIIIIIIILITLTLWSLKEKYPFNIYDRALTVSLLSNPSDNSSFLSRLYNEIFKISIFKSKHEINSYMLILYPQRYHFFIEEDKLIYHPSNKYLDSILKQYRCDGDFELAYQFLMNDKQRNISFIPKVVCHRKLKYLKMFIYEEKSIYDEYFDELQNPFMAIHYTINTMLKNGKKI